jgi:hypothetical protein
MEALTLPIWNASTCATLPLGRASPALTWPCSADSMSPGWWPSVSDSNQSSCATLVEPDQWYRRCGCEGSPRDHVWRQDTTLAAEPRAKRLSAVERGGLLIQG